MAGTTCLPLTHNLGDQAMGCADLSAGDQSAKPDPIAFSLCLPRQHYDGTLGIRPYVGGPQLVAVDVAIGPTHVASLALSEDAAIDAALRLLGAVLRRREGETS